MNAPVIANETEFGLAKLRQPFPANQISKLPKPTKKQTDDVRADFKKGIRCTICGAWHHPDVVHLDYVGHAALTDRLLDTDPAWAWEPAALTEEGLPAFDRNGGLWIKLTVLGVTRLGYGSADGKSGGDAVKEIIGDALRNAAMRFGAALDLWHKGDLHADSEDQGQGQNGAVSPDTSLNTSGMNDDRITEKQESDLTALAQEVGADLPRFVKYLKIDALSDLPADRYQEAVRELQAKRKKAA